MHAEATINGKIEGTELPRGLSPRNPALGELSVSIAGRRDENNKETE